ncbi:MAG: HEAT repeat domain-containing protein [Deltaproteobacteria bacterium]|jgi:hypothetical protein|nr:HEAT repeat domain-containing protein [Deltaproteobacteria bacterium]
MLDPVAGAPAPESFIGDLLGTRTPEQTDFARRLLDALKRSLPDLVPRSLEHPFQAEISQGLGGTSALLAVLDAPVPHPVEAQVAALDALARIGEHHPLSKEVMSALRKSLAAAKDPQVASVAARALAVGRDPEFLAQQRAFLGSTDLAQLRISARLLGYAKDPAAAPVLLELLTLDRTAVADVVIWALGQIGDEAAVPRLHAFLERSIHPEVVIAAVGHIGARLSVMRTLPVLLDGPTPLREAAAEALARIIQKQEGRLGDRDLGRSVLEALGKVWPSDPSKKVRFWAMLGYAGLGGHLAPNEILTALGGGLTDKDLEAVGNLLSKRAPRPKK